MPLRAVLENGQEQLSISLTESDRDTSFLCPACNGKMIPVLPTEDIIKHFRHKIECDYRATDPESRIHLLMKELTKRKIEEDNFIRWIKTECPIGKNKLADIGACLNNGVKVAVECQATAVSTDEFDSRNKIYNKNGFYVLWIFQRDSLDFGETKVSALERKAHKTFFRRLIFFVYDSSSDSISWTVVRFKSVYRERKMPVWGENEYSGKRYIEGWEHYEEKLKTVKEPTYKKIYSFKLGTFRNRDEGTRFAFFPHESYSSEGKNEV